MGHVKGGEVASEKVVRQAYEMELYKYKYTFSKYIIIVIHGRFMSVALVSVIPLIVQSMLQYPLVVVFSIPERPDWTLVQ